MCVCVCIQEFCWTSDSTMDEDRGGGCLYSSRAKLRDHGSSRKTLVSVDMMLTFLFKDQSCNSSL